MPLHTLVRALVVAFFWSSAASAQVPSYVGTKTCTGCHKEAYESWLGSHHADAWREIGPGMFEGAFEGEVFEHDGMHAKFYREADDLKVTVTEKDGVTTDYTVHSVGGVAPLEHPILETEPGRLQSFDVVWDVENREWYHLYPEQDLPPNDGLHWSGPYKNWNSRCAECHATGFSKNYDPATLSYASTQSEIGVGCEACHGPGEAHLRRQRGERAVDYVIPLDQWGFSAQMGDPQKAMQQCAGCHSRREPFEQGNPMPGTPFHDAYNIALLRPALYHADGQILDEVYVYGSFLQSRMQAKGVTCSNCHTPHSAEVKAEGNAVCTQCHSEAGNPDFPSLTLAEYDDPSHTHHAEGSDGAQCVSCHMIERDYMGVDGRRDHSFRIPRPDIATEIGAPDACTDCHADQTSEWAATQISGWFPDDARRQDHYGQTLALGRSNPARHADKLIGLAEAPSQPALVRATALWLLNANAPAERGEVLLRDSDPIVRGAAVSTLRSMSDNDRLDRLAPLLRDPVRSVRVAAAREILTIRQSTAGAAYAPVFQSAFGEFASTVSNQMDFPETHIKLGGLALSQQRWPDAMRAFQTVTALDAQNVDAWIMQVRIAAATAGIDAARQIMSSALAANPGDARLSQLARDM